MDFPDEISLSFRIIIIKKRFYLSWAISHFRPSMKVVLGVYQVALPTMVMEICSVFIMAFLNRVLAVYGCTALAVLGIFMHVRSIIYMPVYGLSQGATPVAGFAYGAGKNDRVKETLVKATVLSLLLIGWGWFIVQYYPLWVMQFFSSDPILLIMGVSCLRLATLVLPLMGPIIILYSVLQALGKGATAMHLSLLRQVGFFLPLIIILPRYYNIQGVWLAFSVSELLSALLALLFFIRKTNTKYILNGLLIGAAVGAGFAVFETAGYALNMSQYYNQITDILFLRGVLAIGGHVAWAAVSGAAIMMVKKDQPLSSKHVFSGKFLQLFIIPVILHAIWDMPIPVPTGLQNLFPVQILLTVAIWFFLIKLVNSGLRQVEEISKRNEASQL